VSTQVALADESVTESWLAEADDEVFRQAEDDAVATVEMQAGLGDGPRRLREAQLREDLANSRRELTDRVITAQKGWMEAERRAANPRATVNADSADEKSRVYRFIFLPLLVLLVVSTLSAIVCLFVAYVVASSDRSLASWRPAALISLGVSVATFVLAVILAQLNITWVARREGPVYRAKADSAKSEYADVLKKFLLGRARVWINLHPLETSEPFSLAFQSAAGLAEVYSPDYLVRNQASEETANLIKQLSGGGAIGLAGPRGAGKTKLIREHCPMGVEDEEVYVDSTVGFLSLMVPAPVEYQPADFVLHLLAKLCQAYLAYHGARDADPPVRPWRRLILWMSRRRSSLRFGGGRQNGPSRAADASKNDQLIAEARYYLQSIRAQRSRTRTVGAGLATPGNIASASGQFATTFTDLPWSYPDMVSKFRSFLRRVALELHNFRATRDAEAGGGAYKAPELRRGVIIGIDELDKISDGDQAQRFVNELKAVLGVPYCHFLISVSDEAQAAFELRGLPLRDAFDSAFDEVIHVRYLRLSDSRLLLRRRVIGMSEPFVRLCHCLSGGLPRDLIRVARHVVLAADRLAPREPGDGPESEHRPVSLEIVCQQLVLQELRGKLDAAEASSWGRAGGLGGDVLHEIQQLVAFAPNGAESVAQCDLVTGGRLPRGLAGVMATLTSPRPVPAGQAAGPLPDLAVYLLYLFTLLQVFVSGPPSADGKMLNSGGQPVPDEWFDQLSSARQMLGVDPRWAWLTIGSCREQWGLKPTYLYPVTPVVDDQDQVAAG